MDNSNTNPFNKIEQIWFSSRNAMEFLNTFYTQVAAFSSPYDRNDGNHTGRLLGQVIEDVDLKNTFAVDFVVKVDAKHPDKLTKDELSTVFLKYCGKTSDLIETHTHYGRMQQP
ncbi:hypothetical protein BGZ65_006118 [Modicella reniformis]|uniref:Uncharacterized protein n=1 Tax=Modicella reniformis TaxID=1440133 RepID=A0A9P6IWI4_9FUNG|nr:hypothetical protein BGZ65_006118 [Modicella reniformis]